MGRVFIFSSLVEQPPTMVSAPSLCVFFPTCIYFQGCPRGHMSNFVGRDRSWMQFGRGWQDWQEGQASLPGLVGLLQAWVGGVGEPFQVGITLMPMEAGTSTWGMSLQWWSCPFCATKQWCAALMVVQTSFTNFPRCEAPHSHSFIWSL